MYFLPFANSNGCAQSRHIAKAKERAQAERLVEDDGSSDGIATNPESVTALDGRDGGSPAVIVARTHARH